MCGYDIKACTCETEAKGSLQNNIKRILIWLFSAEQKKPKPDNYKIMHLWIDSPLTIHLRCHNLHALPKWNLQLTKKKEHCTIRRATRHCFAPGWPSVGQGSDICYTHHNAAKRKRQIFCLRLGPTLGAKAFNTQIYQNTSFLSCSSLWHHAFCLPVTEPYLSHRRFMSNLHSQHKERERTRENELRNTPQGEDAALLHVKRKRES